MLYCGVPGPHQGLFGVDAQAGADHWNRIGQSESRDPRTFNLFPYAAAYADLIIAIGADASAPSTHYIRSFDALLYGVLYSDLARSYGLDASGLSEHYVH